MILQVGSYFRNTKIEDSIYDNRYNMIDMRERSEEKGYSLLFVTNGKWYYRTTTKTFLPTYRIISNGPTITYPKYYRKSQSFEKIIEGSKISDLSIPKLLYTIQFALDMDIPHEIKQPLETFLINGNSTNFNNGNFCIEKDDMINISDELNQDSLIKSPFYIECDIENRMYKIGNRFLYTYGSFIENLIQSLSEYYDTKAAIKILQTEFRLNDFLDNTEETFDFKIYEKIYDKNTGLSYKDRKKFDFCHNIEEKNIQKAIQKLIGWKIPEEGDSNIDEFEPVKFMILNDKFYYIPIYSNPLRGFIVPKTFYKNRKMFTEMNIVDIEIMIYNPNTYEEIEEIRRIRTMYTDMDVLSQLVKILDLLALKYKGVARATISVIIGNHCKKSIIVEDSIHHNIPYQNPLERVYELIFNNR